MTCSDPEHEEEISRDINVLSALQRASPDRFIMRGFVPSATFPPMQDKYLPADIERAAQQHWDSTEAFRVAADASKPKY